MFQLRVGLFQGCVIKMGGRIGDISLAILLLTVLIHCKLMPRGEFISKEQKKRPSKHPILDLLHVCSVQERADKMSVMFSSTG